jgi:putative ATP-binding cassette transporter
MGFVKTSYDYLVVLIPTLFIAPMYFAKEIEFGTITQAGDAFTQILAALSLVVVQFRVFSEFLSQVDRIGELCERMDAIEEERRLLSCSADSITVNEANTSSGEKPGVICENVTIVTPDGKRKLVENLNAEIAFGESLLIMGPSGGGKSSVLRSLAGLWSRGRGVIRRPPLKDMMFLPQRPYMVSGSLRAQLCYPSDERRFSNLRLHLVLEAVGLQELPSRAAGGLDAQQNWGDILSLGEQQRLAFARLLLHRPTFAVLDEATSALDVPNEKRLYGMLANTGVTFVSVGHRESLQFYHRKLLVLSGDGGWTLSPQAGED